MPMAPDHPELDITTIPTAAGREWRIVRWISRWLEGRPHLRMDADASGNLTISPRQTRGESPPVLVTAHLDHPAFVVHRVVGPDSLELEFRGGVMDDYFTDARVALHPRDADDHDCSVLGALAGRLDAPDTPHKRFLCELNSPADLRPGDIATWELPAAEVLEGQLHTNACDDLAAVAVALSMLDELHAVAQRGEPVQDVRVLLTRAEEIGFIGAIAACRHGTIPDGARVIALENSRSFDDSPIGGGPIVRVGDRLSTFSPRLTAAIARRAEDLGGPSAPTAAQKNNEVSSWRWQRKLMAGGACEATVFCAYGHEATCLCLPLGNYHNMADLSAVQAGTNTRPPRVGREHIALSDYKGLLSLLVACGQELPTAAPITTRLDKLWSERASVLDETT